jgi:hypothetical protein
MVDSEMQPGAQVSPFPFKAALAVTPELRRIVSGDHVDQFACDRFSEALITVDVTAQLGSAMVW